MLRISSSQKLTTEKIPYFNGHPNLGDTKILILTVPLIARTDSIISNSGCILFYADSLHVRMYRAISDYSGRAYVLRMGFFGVIFSSKAAAKQSSTTFFCVPVSPGYSASEPKYSPVKPKTRSVGRPSRRPREHLRTQHPK